MGRPEVVSAKYRVQLFEPAQELGPCHRVCVKRTQIHLERTGSLFETTSACRFDFYCGNPHGRFFAH